MDNCKWAAIVGLLVFALADGMAVKDRKEAATKYFRKFGYFSGFSGEVDDGKLKSRVKHFQLFSGLQTTGDLDDVTLKQMTKERCGLKDPDVDLDEATQRKRRYQHQGSFWGKPDLTWFLHNSGRSLTMSEVRGQLRIAFEHWSNVTQMTFNEVTSEKGADLQVRFVTMAHGDPYSFDGAGGVLAHAFYPPQDPEATGEGLPGDIHFDDDEDYSIGVNNPAKKDLLWVATHEIGHSLGLDHSYVKDALMFAWYRGYSADFTLDDDDINGIQALYGAPLKKTTPAPVTTPDFENRPICPPSVDAVFHLKRYSQYDFIASGDKFYLVKDGNIVRSDLSMKAYFKEIKGNVDAAYLREDGKTMFFVGRKYYIYDSLEFVIGPLDLATLGLPWYVDRLYAAQRWYGNGLTYFYTRDRYWRWISSPRSRTGGLLFGPFSLTYAWRGIPQGITACGTFHKNKSLFFKEDKYYSVDVRHVETYKGYPKPISSLLHCKPATDAPSPNIPPMPPRISSLLDGSLVDFNNDKTQQVAYEKEKTP